MKIRMAAIVGTLVLGVPVLFAQPAQQISGFVSEAHCGAEHSSPSEAATKCIKGCMKGGSQPVLVKDGKVYQLKGKTDAVAAHAGEDVTVTGTVDGDTITVAAVEAKS
ncbi:DUF5818 domain-containing protein [Silvibacterium dinghuense]|uniref:DUF5666 domain-containing protein n=1 Tax=Silvibacterium dinghuense TaxID=1560006 RepID=A0A4Q1SDG1_9BACT|nr:DUF5818 domain-containing protein [Silvibacterium dinghuense]RXS95262.1 hypothetical protein ESZ00_11740 [Silvibacterium dinghuense]GGH11951.1 hypothetical protein GCM10011586_30920 [Silvibacterium dinghuense]